MITKFTLWSQLFFLSKEQQTSKTDLCGIRITTHWKILECYSKSTVKQTTWRKEHYLRLVQWLAKCYLQFSTCRTWSDFPQHAVFFTAPRLHVWCPSTLPCCETTHSDPVYRKMLHSLLNTCKTLATFWLVLWAPVDETLSPCSHARSAHHLSVKHFDSCGAGQRQAQFLREFCHCHVDHGTAVSLGLWVQSGAWQ